VLVLVMEGIYEIRHRDGLRWHDVHASFHIVWYRRSEVGRATCTYTQQGVLISLLLF
jgi:hypothetical protein